MFSRCNYFSVVRELCTLFCFQYNMICKSVELCVRLFLFEPIPGSVETFGHAISGVGT